MAILKTWCILYKLEDFVNKFAICSADVFEVVQIGSDERFVVIKFG